MKYDVFPQEHAYFVSEALGKALIPSSDTPGLPTYRRRRVLETMRQVLPYPMKPRNAMVNAKAVGQLAREPGLLEELIFQDAVDFGFVAAARIASVGVGRNSETGNAEVGVGVEEASLTATKALTETLHNSLEGQIAIYETGRIRPQSGPPFGRVDPLRPGCSVSSRKSQWGTLGGIVTSLRDGRVGALTNAHVLLAGGGEVLQPGRGEPGASPRRIGKLQSAISPAEGFVNAADAAVVRLDPDVSHDASVLEVAQPFAGPITAVGSGDEVAKVGAASGLTFGSVVREFSRVAVWYGNRKHEFGDQYEIEGRSDQRFSINGDSGALVVLEQTNEPFAQLFAGVGQRTWASPLLGLLQSFRVELL